MHDYAKVIAIPRFSDETAKLKLQVVFIKF